ncbi:MAG: hypothetical protein SFV55_15010 [Haliscomenobacter sp.]|uniref:hypothetical protein n=1 Tax=Haliscomenobacter sp. TaxID=2717303 RepID=UPI0029B8DCEA|nr:hypothetical protein [Haliscomenobacter sp.]MDX2069736.1 hypothetical protein [Haliscomenobacter sp.]
MEKYTEILSKVDGVFFLIKTLEEDHTPAEVALDTNTQLIWGQIGLTSLVSGSNQKIFN